MAGDIGIDGLFFAQLRHLIAELIGRIRGVCAGNIVVIIEPPQKLAIFSNWGCKLKRGITAMNLKYRQVVIF